MAGGSSTTRSAESISSSTPSAARSSSARLHSWQAAARLVSVAEEPRGERTYVTVEPSPQQLIELARLVDGGELRVAIDSTFALSEAATAFERSLVTGKNGKVVLRVADESSP